jgi:hypothetical protein
MCDPDTVRFERWLSKRGRRAATRGGLRPARLLGRRTRRRGRGWLRLLKRKDRWRRTPIGKTRTPNQIGWLEMTLRDKSAHFGIGQRAVLFAFACDVPLNVSLLACHESLMSLRGAVGFEHAAPRPGMAFLHGANVVRRTPARQLAALAREPVVHGGILAALLRSIVPVIRRRKSRTFETLIEVEG